MAYNVQNHSGIFSYEHFNRKYPNFLEDSCMDVFNISVQVASIACNIFVAYATFGTVFSLFTAGLSLGAWIFRYGLPTRADYDAGFMMYSCFVFYGLVTGFWCGSYLAKTIFLLSALRFSYLFCHTFLTEEWNWR